MQSDDVLARSTRGSWWARHPRPLAKVGVTLVIVSAAILWVIFTRRPEAAPAVARFCFAKRDETILAAAPRLAALRA